MSLSVDRSICPIYFSFNHSPSPCNPNYMHLPKPSFSLPTDLLRRLLLSVSCTHHACPSTEPKLPCRLLICTYTLIHFSLKVLAIPLTLTHPQCLHACMYVVSIRHYVPAECGLLQTEDSTGWQPIHQRWNSK